MRAPAHAEDTRRSTASAEPRLVDCRLEIPVPVRTHRESEASGAQLAERFGYLGVCAELPLRTAGVQLVQDQLVLAGVDVGLCKEGDQALVLPRDVVLATAGLVEVLDPVEITIPPSVP